MPRKPSRDTQLERLLELVKRESKATQEGHTAYIAEESGEPVERDSDSWYREASEIEREVFELAATL